MWNAYATNSMVLKKNIKCGYIIVFIYFVEKEKKKNNFILFYVGVYKKRFLIGTISGILGKNHGFNKRRQYLASN